MELQSSRTINWVPILHLAQLLQRKAKSSKFGTLGIRNRNVHYIFLDLFPSIFFDKLSVEICLAVQPSQTGSSIFSTGSSAEIRLAV